MGFFPTDVGAQVKSMRGISPQSTAAATVNGPAIDRQDFFSAVLAGITGAATGSPTAISVIYKLQDSADGSTGWVDFGGSVTVDAVNEHGRVDVNLGSAKRYIRAVAVVSFTGGTTPQINIGAVVALGGAQIKPADRGIE